MMIEKTPRGPVHTSGSYTGAQSILRSFLSLLHRFVPSPDAGRCASQEDRARQITAIVAEYSTQVQHDQFVFLQSFFGWTRMRQSGARPRSHDSVERRSACAFAAQTVVDLSGNVQFRYTWTNKIRSLRNDLGSEPSGTAHQVEFLHGLHFTDAFHEPVSRFPCDLASCSLF